MFSVINEQIAGKHQLGGDIPADFKIPENKFLGGFQYIGYIDNSDPQFSWMPFSLHMICPIYLNIEEVILDYSDPQKPLLLEPTDSAEVTTEYDELLPDSVVIFEPVKFALLPPQNELSEDDKYEIAGLAGTPVWIQDTILPICPKNGKPMRFVCQLKSNGHIKTKYTNVVSKDEFFQDYFNVMNFWCDGDLYVFMQPESKTVCYAINCT